MNNIALVIMDGVGIGHRDSGDMVWNASTPTLFKKLWIMLLQRDNFCS